MKMMISTPAHRDVFIHVISEFKLEGKKKFVAEFKVHRQKRSLKQNRLYHAYLNMIESDTGNDHDAMHEFFKRKLLSWTCHDIYDEEIPIVQSTTKLNTKEFTDFLDKVKAFMMEQGVYLPAPGEAGFDEFWEQYGNNQ